MSHPIPALANAPVTILLSTFNGALHLEEQLASLCAQTLTGWVLYWRDDGSDDATTAIMTAFTARLGPERVICSPSSGMHMGAAVSFLTLLTEATNSNLIAFADQDDVWLPGKLAAAQAMLAQAGDRPALYCARQYLVNERLEGDKLSVLHRTAAHFPACLTQNIANGNTLVLNQAAAALVAQAGRPAGTVHDWWSYIVVSACGGKILFDERPQVLYRLHKANLIGRLQPLHERALAALRRGPQAYMTMMHRHADMLGERPANLSPQARRDLRRIRAGLHGGLISRASALACPRFRRRLFIETLLFRVWFMLATTHRAHAQGQHHALPPLAALAAKPPAK
ncbi:glycosyltransferase [Acidocella sp.]|uniref:glycosyltransferase n=1 Tax=Acidocella sp. TaxID=50710 RepID=UPI00260489B1|nr:glycosyltransferase [Acidocella sp.]